MDLNSIFRFSLDNSLEMVIMFRDDGKIVYANESAQIQLEYEKLCGHSVVAVFPSEFSLYDGIVHWDEKEVSTLHDTMAYRKNQTCFPVKMKLFEYEKGPGEIIDIENMVGQTYHILMACDSSTENFLEKKATQAGQEAEEAQKVKSEFVANVTHELRTPVNGVLGNTKELLEIETDREKLKLLGLIERSCRDMNAIINNILDFSKLNAGKFALDPRKFHFRNMMDYVKGNHGNRIIEKGLEFSITISQDVPEYVIGDELRIVQILNNLISNAYKFTSVGSIHVEVVKTAHNQGQIELFFMVMDTGIGISKVDQDKLFKSFSQVDASISRKYGGTGLGLNITKQLVELMNGNIHVQSQQGEGTIFSFSIWVQLSEESEETMVVSDSSSLAITDEQELMRKLHRMSEEAGKDKIWTYGEPENKEEVQKKMSKLILCMEMDNWEKAEMFAETVKKLLAEAPQDIKSAALRLKMSVQKGDYEKAVTSYEKLKQLL